MSSPSLKNQYVFYRNDQEQAHFSFEPENPTCLDHVDYKYFGRVLHALEPQIKNRGLIIYVTGWTVHELPSYGPNVISCILQDEWGREPHYRDKVGMVFKTCGTNPYNLQAYQHGGGYDYIGNFLGQSLAFSRGYKGCSKTLISRIKGKHIAPIYEIPLGYYTNEDISYIPFENRKNDIFFAGSIQHITQKKLSIKRPKELARDRMSQALRSLQENHPDIHVQTSITAGFGESIVNNNQAYAQNMMGAKIALIPRGANLETFRFYEAIRYGCIPVGENFPRSWFYDDAPIIRLDDWSDISKEIPTFLNDPDKCSEMHEKVLQWWKKMCAEDMLASYIAQKILEDNND